MFNIPIFDNGRITACTNEKQTTIIVQDKATDEVIRLVKGDEVATFQRHTRVAGFIEQIRQENEAKKAQLDAQAELQINTALSESAAYFNGFAV